MISERASELFLEARTLDPETRAEFLSMACEGNANLRDEVESLLAAANESEAYFDNLTRKVSLSALADEDDTPLPDNKLIGSWRLLKRIGRGGMGAVYLAERAGEDFDHRAALKILPRGLDSDQARGRFLVERQILARLVHDNIARLLDGGVTEDGLPYFVMDYVEGLPIDQYCDENGLDTDQRLALILDVASAVQYAHRNLIIHRDLKPSNVLVDDRGRVRLLDFGIAKMLDPDPNAPPLTQESRRPVTPAFASPEMLCGEAVDITTDVYSIGALMYVLFAGRQPLDYDGLSLTELYTRARDELPLPVSRFDQNLEGDLDAIVAKALAKLPAERYESVQSLANDIRNYLGGLPITAKAPSSLYKTRKFIGRHRIGVAFSTFAIAALAIIAGLAIRSAVVSDRQSQQIALERDRAEQTKEFLISIFNSADPNVVADEQTAREILEAGRARIEDELAEQPAVQADLLRAMSLVYQSWRQADEGRAVLERELELREAVNGIDSREYAGTLVALAYISEFDGDYDASLNYAQRAADIFEGLNDDMGHSSALERIGRIKHLQGNLEEADAYFNRALDLVVQHKGPGSYEEGFLREHLGNLNVHRQQYEAALVEFEKALHVRRRTISGDNSEISPIHLGMGSALTKLGRLDEAVESYEAGLAINNRLFGEDNSYNLYFVNGLGKVAEARGDLETAISRYEEAKRLIERYTPQSPNLAFSYANIGKVNMLLGQYDVAVSYYRTALAIYEEKLPMHWAVGEVKWRLGLCLVETGRYAEGEPYIREGLESVERRWGPDHESAVKARAAAARLYEAWGKPEQALAFR